MENVKQRWEGTWNIVRFNWPFFAITGSLILTVFTATAFLEGFAGRLVGIGGMLLLLPLLLSLAASHCAYDRSRLYDFRFLNEFLEANSGEKSHVLNVHAGFDESSELIRQIFPESKLTVFDFYDPVLHTEASIKRARKCRPPFSGTLPVKTDLLPLDDSSVDLAVVFLAAHEIRKKRERLAFFSELHRVLKPNGALVVTEHLRDLPNFVAYNIGFFHFLPRRVWEKVFRDAGFLPIRETVHARLIHTFILRKHGTAS